MANGTLSALNDSLTGRVYHNTDYAVIDIHGTFVGTVTLSKFVDGHGFVVLDTYTAPVSEAIRHGDVTRYKLEMTAYTSGSANVSIK